MNSWKIVWKTYHESGSRRKVLWEMVSHSSIWSRIYVGLLSALFLIGIVLYVISSTTATNFGYLIVTIASEVALLFKVDSMKKDLVLNEYGDSEEMHAPPEPDRFRDTRYLMFKHRLEKAGIKSSHVSSCFELVTIQIDMAQTNDQPYRKFLSYSLGLVSGVVTALWHDRGRTELIYTAVLILAVALFVTFILSIFPSKLERLKEMKYFMTLYCRKGTLKEVIS